MEIIGELVDAAEEIIQEKAGHTCHPFYCDSIPCYQTGDCKISIALSYRLTQRRETCEEPRGISTGIAKAKKDVINNAAYESS